MSMINEGGQSWDGLVGQADEVVRGLGGSSQHPLMAEVDWTTDTTDYKLRRLAIGEEAGSDTVYEHRLFVEPRGHLDALRAVTFNSRNPESLKAMDGPLSALEPVTTEQDRSRVVADIRHILSTAPVLPKPPGS